MENDKESQKKNAAIKALEYVQDGMALGLGTGSTADYFVKELAKKKKDEGLGLKCIATSARTKNIASQNSLEIASLEDVEKIDLAVDGADSVDEGGNLLKGYGGALLREKIVAYNSEKFIAIVDESKLCDVLQKPVPVEYTPFAHPVVVRELKGMGAKGLKPRTEGSQRFVSDNSNWILDAGFGVISNPSKLEQDINSIVGVVENGIFSKGVFKVIAGKEEGVQEIEY